ncbi:alpha/beta hydrolase-fold protein [Thalassotalea psychrophila]|uniref:Alpha/beta hydrolase-fold protein n=1 Tax=Thalassotalea psychrophila TaxID=3065647 RepID=A0ABY9TUC3_9GAMM|nr:alpha/beta hydrolase-fold protein [Colwelliaceae bacterium SQ149]
MFRYIILLISIISLCACSPNNSEITLIVKVPENTPQHSKLTLGGDFNSWDPTADGFEMTAKGDGIFEYNFPTFEKGKILNFKVTRGSWDTVEISDTGANRDNRNYTVSGHTQVINIEVADWTDLSTKEAPSTVVGTVVVEDIELPTFKGQRKVRIYLPPHYKDSNERFPVIYMTDGQNVFDDKTANAGEWQMDELMEKFAENGSALTSIVVAVDHAGDNRRMEYLPFNDDDKVAHGIDGKHLAEAKGAEFADWLVNELKPSIDKQYRSKPEREYTSLMGSSMGGLISCYTALRHQEVISKAACLSSAFLKRLVGSHFIDYIKQTPKKYPMKFHIDIGDNEFGLFGDNILKETQEVYEELLLAGFNKPELRYQIIQGGTHDEPSWRSRTEDILLWLNKS